MKLNRSVGVTSEIWQIFIQDSSSTTGAGLTGLTNSSSGLTAYYHRDTDTTATAISVVTMTSGTFTSGGFKEIDSTNMPGWYQFCPPNAALATGAKSCAVHLKGVTNMAPLPIEVDLNAQVNVMYWSSGAVPSPAVTGVPKVDDNYLLGTIYSTPATAGILDVNLKNIAGSAVSTTTAQLGVNVVKINAQTATAAAGVTFPSSIASPTNITGGTITTVTNLTNAPTAGDFTATMKASITTAATAATPTAAAVTGAVGSVNGNVGGNVTGTVGSVVGAVGSVTGLTASNLDTTVSSRLATSGYTAPPSASTIASAVYTGTMTESYPTQGSTFTLAQAVYQLVQQAGQMSISGTTETVLKRDGSTTAKTFTLNDATNPTAIVETT